MTAGALTGLYRQRLAAAAPGYVERVLALWGWFSRDDPLGTLDAIGRAAGPLVAEGQAAFTAETLAYLRGLTADASAASLTATAPYAVPPGVTGFGANGAPISSVTGLARSVYRQRLAAGHPPESAEVSAHSWLARVAASAPYRAAADTVAVNAVNDERLTGRVVRVPEPGACPFCMRIADRGYVPVYLPGGRISTGTFPAHAWCRCTGSPEISAHVYARSQQRYARRAQARSSLGV